MLEKIAEQGSEHPLHLIYGVTHDHDLVEMDKLEAFLRCAHPQLHLQRLRRQPGQRLSAEGLRDPAHRAQAPQRR